MPTAFDDLPDASPDFSAPGPPLASLAPGPFDDLPSVGARAKSFPAATPGPFDDLPSVGAPRAAAGPFDDLPEDFHVAPNEPPLTQMGLLDTVSQPLKEIIPKVSREAVERVLTAPAAWARERMEMTPDDQDNSRLTQAMANSAPSDKAISVATGAEHAGADLVNFFTSPLGISTLGIGALPKAAQSAVALMFAGQMASGVPGMASELGAELGKPEPERDYQKISELVANAAAAVGFSALGVAHGAGRPVAEKLGAYGGGKEVAAPAAQASDLAGLEAAMKANQVGPVVAPRNPVHAAVLDLVKPESTQADLDAAVAAKLKQEHEQEQEKTKTERTGITDEDGLLLSIVGDVGKIPAFVPDSAWRRKYESLRDKASGGGLLTPEQKLWMQDNVPANFEDDYGDAHQAAYRAAERAGIASELFQPTDRPTGLDQVLEGIKDATGKDLSADELWQRIESLSNAKTNRETSQSRDKAFWDAAMTEPKNKSGMLRVNSGELRIGETFQLKAPGATKETFEVTHIDPDANEVTVKDGPTFGTQTIPDGADLWIKKGRKSAVIGGKTVGQRLLDEHLRERTPEEAAAQRAELVKQGIISPEVAPAAEPPPSPAPAPASIGAGINKALDRKGEAGAVNLPSFREWHDYGKEVYSRVKDFSAWSADMIRQFGESIRAHLQEIWRVVKDGFDRAQDPLGFYDNIQDALRSWQNKGTPEQLLAHLKKFAGAMDEAEEIGLHNWLEDKASVSRPEVEEFLRQHRVGLKEVDLHEEDTNLPQNAEERKELEDLITSSLKAWDKSGMYADAWASKTEKEVNFLRSSRDYGEDALKALRNGDSKAAIESVRQAISYEMAGNGTHVTHYPAWRETWRLIKQREWDRPRNTPQFAPYQLPGGKNYHELTLRADELPERALREGDPRRDHQFGIIENHPDGWRDGHAQYQNIENPVVRVRINDRTAPDGKKVLFIEEMQGPSRENQELMPPWLRERIYDLGLKRMLRYAAERGYDRLEWTTGDQQADRYSLRKQIDSLYYHERLKELRAFKNDYQIFKQGDVLPEQLPDYVGKAAAKALLDNPMNESGSRSLYGQQLEVGGEGLRALYDQTLVNKANKLLKKWGGRVGEDTVDGEKVHAIDLSPLAKADVMTGQRLYTMGALDPDVILPKTARDRISQWLDRAIEATDPLGEKKRGELQGGMALPKWITKTVAHEALKVVRAAYRAGGKIVDAIEEGVAWLHEQKLPGFDHREARAWLTDAAAQPETENANAEPAEAGTTSGESIQALQEQRAAIAQRLDEINGLAQGPGRILPKELKSERYQLAKEAKEIGRKLANDPVYVADLIRKMDKLGQDMVRGRQAGNGLGFREAGEELRALMEGDLQVVPHKLFARTYNELLARGEITGTESGEMPGGRTLGSLNAWLDAKGLDSPRLSLRERFQQSRVLADRFDDGKKLWVKAADRASAAWKVFAEQWKRPPVDGSFRSLVKDWLFEKQWTGLESHRWIQSIRRQVSNPLRRSALSVWIDAGGDENLLRAQADDVPDRYKQIWKTALTLTADEKALGRRVESEFEEKLESAMNAGLIKRGREDYGMPQVWQTAPKIEAEYDPAGKHGSARKTGAKLDPRDPFFSLQRTVPSYFDGIMAGGVPKSLDLGDLVGKYNVDFHDALADRGMIRALKDAKAADGEAIVKISGSTHVEPTGEPGEGGRTFFVDSNSAGKTALTADGRPYQTVDHWALKDWKFASKDANGNPIIVRGNFMVHPDHYKFLKNELGQSWFRDPEGGGNYFNPLLKTAAFLKASKFASASFHLATLGEHALFHGISPITRGVELDPSKSPKLAGLMRGGMDLGMGAQRQLFEEGLSSHGGIYKYVPGLGDAMGRMSDFLFKDYLPKIKAKTGLVVLERNLKRYGGELSNEQINELTARQVNAAYGGQNWQMMGRNKAWRDINGLLLTAPDFLLSRSKVVAQAFKPFNAEQRYFILAQAAGVYVAARVLNMLFDGDPHWEWENVDRVIYHGRAYSGRFLVSDILHLLSDKGSFWSGRLGPLPKAAAEAVWGRDLRTGVRKDVPFETNSWTWRAVQILAKDMAEWLVPLGVEGFLPGAAGREQTGLGQAALGLVGVGSHKYTPETQMWELARDFNHASTDPRVQQQVARNDSEAHAESAYRKLDNLIEAGELDRARKEYDALVAEGHRPELIEKHFTEVNRPFTGQVGREGQFRASLTPAQRGAYDRAIAARRERLGMFRRLRVGVEASALAE